MQIRKAMAVLFAVVLMVGILPTRTFAEPASTDITISDHKTGQLGQEISEAAGTFLNSITSITVSGEAGQTLDSDDWLSLNTALRTSSNVTKVDLSGTSSSGSTQQGTFYKISSLKTVLLPNDLTSIGNNDFYGCTGLTSISIPETVTSIGSSAFCSCTGLTTITIPADVTSMGDNAFEDCTSLSTVNISGSKISSIGQHAFDGCISLTSITIPEGPTSIGGWAFEGCSGLQAVTIPGSVTSIGNQAFENCTSLSSVTFSGTPKITQIGNTAFSGDTSLASITIPASVTTIDFNAFFGCTGLSTVTVSSNPPISVGNLAFGNIAQEAVLNVPQGSENTWDTYGSETADHRIQMGGKQFKIEDLPPMLYYEINRVSDTEAQIYISSDEAGIYYYKIVPASDTNSTIDTSGAGTSFTANNGWYNTIIQKADLSAGPYTLYIIAKDLHGNTMNKTVNIDPYCEPKDLIISHRAGKFGDKTEAGEVVEVGELSNAMTAAGIPTGRYDLINSLTVSGEAFNDADWQALADAYAEDVNQDEVKMVNVQTVNLSGVSSTSPVPNKTFSGLYSLQSVVLPSGVTGLGEDSFSGCSSLTSISIPSSVTSIGDSAFEGCSSLASVTIPSGVTSIEDRAFADCSSLASVTIPSSVTSIGRGAFMGCSTLASIIIPGSVASIGGSAFADCSSLASVTIPGSVTSIGSGAFVECSSLASVTIPGSVTSIGSGAFAECSSLASVTIPGSVTSIGSGAFADCSSLASITIPSSVTSIGDSAFAGCSSLASITSLMAAPPTPDDSGSDHFSGLPSTGTLTVPSGSAAIYKSTWGQELSHWTITEASTPAPNGGGAPSGNSTYSANVSGSGSQTTLPVTVDAGSKTASIDLGPQSFSQSGAVITVPSIPDTYTYSAKISVSDLSTSAAKGTLTVKTGNGSITVPSNMLTSGTSGSKASISIGQADKSALPATVQTAIGDHPLIQLSMNIDGKQTEWNNPNAPVTVSIPYKPTAAELKNPEGIVIWYIDGSGKAVSVPSGHYDPATGTVTFQTTHFSNYAVAYHPVSFTDIPAGAWYYDAVSFAGARGIAAGTDESRFSPNAALTRGQFLVMLMQTYGIPSDEKPSDNFADAGNTYYTGYLAAAKSLGITTGVGSNLFAPDKGLTRQEMSTLLYNMLKTLDKLPKATSGKALSDFTDSSDVSAWAKDAMAELVKAGIVTGSGKKLSPTTATTRAQTAQILYALLTK